MSFGCRSRHEVILCWEALSPVTSVLKERTEEDSREAGPEVGQSRAASAGLCGQGLRPPPTQEAGVGAPRFGTLASGALGG